MRIRSVVALVLCAGCLAAQPATATLPSGPSHCSAADLRSALFSFSRSFNRGRSQALDAIFARKPDFQWYVTDGRIGTRAKRRDTLIPYLSRRHRKGERLHVARFQFNGNSPHWGNFEMTFLRSVPGVDGGRPKEAPGKGAAVCADGAVRLIVLTFGTKPG